MSREKECKCCHEWWYASVIKEDLCPNCYDYFKQLKQQLEEKDKEINSLIVDYEKRISQEQELMSNMEHRLTEKQNEIDKINKEFVQAVHDWKTLCAEKDNLIEFGREEIRKRNKRIDEIVERDMKICEEKNKEIGKWHKLYEDRDNQFQSVRQRYHLLNRLQASYDKKDKLHLSEMQCLELVEKNEELQKNQKQLAIQELAEVERLLYESHYKEIDNRYYAEYEDIKNLIDSRIKALEKRDV